MTSFVKINDLGRELKPLAQQRHDPGPFRVIYKIIFSALRLDYHTLDQV